MRVLLVQGSSAGGVGRHVAALARDLRRAGHEVVVAGPAAAQADFGIDSTGALFEAVEISDRPHPRTDVASVARLRALAAEVDAVHAHGLRAAALTALALRPVLVAGRTRGVRFVATVHNAPVGSGLLRSGVLGAATRVLERLVAERADVVLAVSGDLVARMQRRGASVALRALVPAPPGEPARRPRDEVRAGLGLPPGAALLVSVARLAPQKDLPLLLDAVAQLRRRRPDLRVLAVVAGDGPLHGALAARVAAEALPVRLLGRRSDVADLLAAADVAVQTSVWEGQPLAVQEALRLGAPVVATDVGGTAEVTGDAAVLVPPRDPAALADALAALLDDPARRAALSAAGRARAASLPSDADAVAQVLACYVRSPQGAG